MNEIFALSAGRTSPAELRERLAFDEEAARRFLSRPHPGLNEIVLLSTCHRTEAYATGDHRALRLLFPAGQMTFLRGAEALTHLFRVASGLDSLVIGETQILGQVRRAFVRARDAGAAGPVLSNAFSRALRAGRRARAESGLGSHIESIGELVAVHLAEPFGSLDGRRGAVIGAGAAARDSATALRARGALLEIVSRSVSHGEELAARVQGTAHGLDSLRAVLNASEFAVVAVSGGALVRREHVPRPIPIVDLSVPRAVVGPPSTTIEDLRPTKTAIELAVAVAERIVREEVRDYEHRLRVRRLIRSAAAVGLWKP